MAENKPTNAANSVDASKSNPKKHDAPILMWCDKNIDESNQENKFVYYNDVQQCIDAIEQSSLPIFLILNSVLATNILSRVHPLAQIDTVFIYCKTPQEQQRCQYLCQHYSKIFDLFTDRKQLLETIQENIILHEKQSGNDYLRIGERYQARKEFNRALKYTHKALDIYRKTLSNQNHPIIARCLNNLGGIYDAQGDVNRSFEFYEQSIKIYSHLAPSLASEPLSNLLKK